MLRPPTLEIEWEKAKKENDFSFKFLKKIEIVRLMHDSYNKIYIINLYYDNSTINCIWNIKSDVQTFVRLLKKKANN